jgi:glycine hydroxymethyltransferase
MDAAWRKRVDELKRTDAEIYEIIKEEERYQLESVRLIPSENYVSAAVLQATGSVLTNKYSEGYAGRRYYEGQRYIDAIETLAVERAKALFGAEHANVQPYSARRRISRSISRCSLKATA